MGSPGSSSHVGDPGSVPSEGELSLIWICDHSGAISLLHIGGVQGTEVHFFKDFDVLEPQEKFA